MNRLSTHARKVAAVTTKLDESHALLVFARAFHSSRRHELDLARSGIGSLTNRELDSFASELDNTIATLRADLRPTQPLSFYVDFLRAGEIGPGQVIFVARWQLKSFFAGIEEVLKGLANHPEHTLVSFDLHGIYPAGTPGEVRILEAALFEDMCALFNRGVELSPIAAAKGAAKRLIKECAAARRGAVLAAFYFVEAYLNSLAFDYLVANAHREPDADMDKITEWDHVKGRERLVSFRNKLIGYPRIILHAEHPPLHENNCPELKFLVEEAKQFRDAIVHANPRPNPFKLHSTKERMFWRIGSVTTFSFARGMERSAGTEDPMYWERMIDSSIAVVERIENLIHGASKRLFWLQKRTPSGVFNDSVFD